MHNTLSSLTCLSFYFGLLHSFAKSLLYIGHCLYLLIISDSYFPFLHIGQTRSHLTLHLIRLSAIYTSSYTLYYLTLLSNTCVVFLETWCNPMSSYRPSAPMQMHCRSCYRIFNSYFHYLHHMSLCTSISTPCASCLLCYTTHCSLHIYMIISAFILLHFSFPPSIFQLSSHRWIRHVLLFYPRFSIYLHCLF